MWTVRVDEQDKAAGWAQRKLPRSVANRGMGPLLVAREVKYSVTGIAAPFQRQSQNQRSRPTVTNDFTAGGTPGRALSPGGCQPDRATPPRDREKWVPTARSLIGHWPRCGHGVWAQSALKEWETGSRSADSQPCRPRGSPPASSQRLRAEIEGYPSYTSPTPHHHVVQARNCLPFDRPSIRIASRPHSTEYLTLITPKPSPKTGSLVLAADRPP